MQELVIAINEFFEFNYEYIIKKVISPKIKAEILEDYYHNGMKQRMDNNIAEKLFWTPEVIYTQVFFFVKKC